MSIQTCFSIKDLENLSGIKAHTIRIWEKRYNLLSPERSGTNIRTYDLTSLQKILNVALLIQHGHKISAIASIPEKDLYRKVRELVVHNNDSDYALNSFKLSMLNFDQPLFDHTYNQLLTQHSFRDLFLNVFLTLLDDIGMLWATKTITPAHEHFISTLIKQKLLVNIERVQNTPFQEAKTFILFLPINEIHELGLLYIHFELLLKGYKSIYLGPSVPIDNLKGLQKVYPNTEFVTYFTVEPKRDEALSYLEEMNVEILQERGESVHVLGRNIQDIDTQKLTSSVHAYESITAFVDSVD